MTSATKDDLFVNSGTLQSTWRCLTLNNYLASDIAEQVTCRNRIVVLLLSTKGSALGLIYGIVENLSAQVFYAVIGKSNNLKAAQCNQRITGEENR